MVSRLWYITYGGADYESTTERIVTDAPGFGVDNVLVYDDLYLREHEFFRLPGNQWLWHHHWPRGDGWFSWKALILLETLDKMQDGDVVIYTDADRVPIADLTPIKDIASREGAAWFRASANYNRHWCKSQCRLVMGNHPMSYTEPAGDAGVIAFKKGPWATRQFLMEWLTYCVNPLANTLDPSMFGEMELPDFYEHRADQSIMTLLCLKYGWKCHRDPSQHGAALPGDDLYHQLFTHVDGMTKPPSAPRGSRFRNT